MATGQTGTGCLDCCPGCLIGSDDFSANDGRPHAGWTNRPAIWSTAGGDEATNAGGVFVFAKPNVQKFNTAHPDGATGQFHVRVRFKLTELVAGDGVAADVIVGYLDDNTYLFARVLYQGDNGNSCNYLQLLYRTGGAETGIFTTPKGVSTSCFVPIRGLTLDEWHTIDVCLLPNTYGTYGDGDTIRGHVTLADGTHWGVQGIAEGFTGGAFVGLGNAETDVTTHTHGSVEFDDFKFNYFRETPDHASCPNCNTPCFIFADPLTYDDHELDGTACGSPPDCPECFWSTIDGAARIDTNRLEVDNGGLVRCNVRHPQSKTSKIVTVSILWETGIVARVDLGTGYAQFDSTNRRIFLRDNDDNLLDSTAVNSLPAFDAALHEVEVCYRGGGLTVTAFGECLSASSPDTGDPFVYLGSDGGTVHFDSFSFSKAKDLSEPADGGCVECESCPVPCTDGCIDDVASELMMGTIQGTPAPGTCSGFDASEIDGMAGVAESGLPCIWTNPNLDGVVIYEGVTGVVCPEAGGVSCPDNERWGCYTLLEFRLDNITIETVGSDVKVSAVWNIYGHGMGDNLGNVRYEGLTPAEADCTALSVVLDYVSYNNTAFITDTEEPFDFSGTTCLVESV